MLTFGMLIFSPLAAMGVSPLDVWTWRNSSISSPDPSSVSRFTSRLPFASLPLPFVFLRFLLYGCFSISLYLQSTISNMAFTLKQHGKHSVRLSSRQRFYKADFLQDRPFYNSDILTRLTISQGRHFYKADLLQGRPFYKADLLQGRSFTRQTFYKTDINQHRFYKVAFFKADLEKGKHWMKQ